MTVAEDELWGLLQAGRRLERYVEDFLEQTDYILFHPTPRTSTYRTNGSDRLPNSKSPLILRRSTSVLKISQDFSMLFPDHAERLFQTWKLCFKDKILRFASQEKKGSGASAQCRQFFSRLGQTWLNT